MKDVCYILDENYKVGFLTSLYSLLKNNESGLRIHIIQTPPFPLDKEIEALKKQFDFEAFFYDSNYEYTFKKEDVHGHINNSCYHVLRIQNILDLDEVLYMDCDTLVLGDIKELLETDVDNHFLAASYDIYPNTAVEKDLKKYDVKKERIFNSGVMKFNLKLIRETSLEEFTNNFVFKVSKNECGGDQYILNAFFSDEGCVNIFSCKYNFLTGYLYYNHIRKQFAEERNWGDDYSKVFDGRKEGSIRIFHFITGEKPWRINEENPKFNNMFYQYWYAYNNELNQILK